MTWNELVAMEPRLVDLERDCKHVDARAPDYGKEHASRERDISARDAEDGFRFTAWFRGCPDLGLDMSLKRRMVYLVGWLASGTGATLHSKDAYDLAYKHLAHEILRV
jgi:hypothetical protein